MVLTNKIFINNNSEELEEFFSPTDFFFFPIKPYFLTCIKAYILCLSCIKTLYTKYKNHIYLSGVAYFTI